MINTGKTALMYAIEEDHPECIEHFVESGDVNYDELDPDALEYLTDIFELDLP